MLIRPDLLYADWSMPQLVISNFLREHPVSYPELSLYAGHKSASLRVCATTMRRTGRLTKNNIVIREHPANSNFQPLPDRVHSQFTNPHDENRRVEAQAIVTQVVGPLGRARLTMDQLIEITDEYIRTGAAGKDLLNAVRARIDLEGIAPPPLGPPPPSTPTTFTQRLHDLIVEVPDAILEAALATRLDTLRARAGMPLSCPEQLSLFDA